MSVEIEVCERLGDFREPARPGEAIRPKYHAQIKGDASTWADGNNPREAIGNLIWSNPELFGVIVTDLGKQAR